jgi:predicted outer membrane repeat protein
MRAIAAPLLLSLAMAGLARADTLEVCQSGCVYTTIQDAIDASSDGDVVLVLPGLYNELVNFSGKEITVSGSGSSVTTIDGSGLAGSVVTFDHGEGPGSVLEGFRIGNGTGTFITDPIFGSVPCGGGIFVIASSPIIRDCTLTSNTCWGGAGMMNLNASPQVVGCQFTLNLSEGHGGGAYNLDHSDPEFLDCTFDHNSASWGGGMTSTVDCAPKVTGCVFSENTVGNVGGGMFSRSRSSPVVIGCTFIGNMQTGNPLGSGGGMCTYGSGNGGGPCYPIVLDCHFEGNIVNGDGAGMSHAYDSHPTISNCTYVGNQAGRNGGGMACVGNADPYVPSNAIVNDCTFTNNQANEDGGGFHSRSSTPTVEGCQFETNVALVTGGGAGFENSDLAQLGTSMFCGNLPDNYSGIFDDIGGNTSDEECVDCIGDANGDLMVNVEDLLDIIGAWGECPGCPEDFDGDGFVGVEELLAIIANWGPCD